MERKIGEVFEDSFGDKVKAIEGRDCSLCHYFLEHGCYGDEKSCEVEGKQCIFVEVKE